MCDRLFLAKPKRSNACTLERLVVFRRIVEMSMAVAICMSDVHFMAILKRHLHLQIVATFRQKFTKKK